MHNLFEVVRLLSIGKEPGLKQKQQVYVTNFAWKEEGEISLLALACSNGKTGYIFPFFFSLFFFFSSLNCCILSNCGS